MPRRTILRLGWLLAGAAALWGAWTVGPARDAGTPASVGTTGAGQGAPARIVQAAAPSRPLVARASVSDAGFALTGAELRRPVPGPARLQGALTLVTLTAAWCGPCVAELPEVVALADALHEAHGARLLLVATDGGDRPETLAGAVTRLFERHRADFAAGRALALPPWAELRADPGWAWAALARRGLGADAPAEPTLPLSMLFDRCGGLQVVVEGALDRPARDRLRGVAEALARSPAACPPGP